MSRYLFTVAILAAVLVCAGAAAPTGGLGKPADLGCDWDIELASTLGELGERGSDWSVTHRDTSWWGETDLRTRHATLSADVPCREVASVVRHEWMHLQQARYYGAPTAMWTAYGWPRLSTDEAIDSLEQVADCGAWLLGAEQPAQECEGWPLANAQVLISETSIGGSPARQAIAPTHPPIAKR